jgi:hypothetical protein
MNASLVWRPGSKCNGPVVYDKLLDAVNASHALSGALVTINIDGSAAPDPDNLTVDAGAYTGMGNVSFYAGNEFLFVTCPDGVTWDALPPAIVGPTFVSTSSQPIISLAPEEGDIPYLTLDAAILRSPGAAPFLQVTSGEATIYSYMAALGAGAVGVSAGATLGLLGYALYLYENALSGEGAVYGYLDSTSTLAPQSVAEFDVELASVANMVDYTPANLASWAGVAPASTADALDRLAALVGPVPPLAAPAAAAVAKARRLAPSYLARRLRVKTP